jgi:tetratricopeptide (TPR) repeat protein
MALVLSAAVIIAPVARAKSVTTNAARTGANSTKKVATVAKPHYSKSVRAIIRLGKRGGDLAPVSNAFSKADNASFVSAITAWNGHHWRDGVRLFRKHLRNHPNSPWAGEANLHIGCFYRYTGQYRNAVQQFGKVIKRFPGTDVSAKALKRQAGAYFLQGDYKTALKLYLKLFGDTKASWRHRTYALYWARHLQRLEAAKKHAQALNQCGLKSLALVYKQLGKPKRAKAMAGLADRSTQVASFGYLRDLLRLDYPQASLVRTDAAGLRAQKFPVIAHVDADHFVVVAGLKGDTVLVHDPYRGTERQTLQQFEARWDGTLLSRTHESRAVAHPLSGINIASITGGCCGNPLPAQGLGHQPLQPLIPGANFPACHGHLGSPQYSINAINLNLMIEDTPFYYTPGKGLPVKINMTFNSGDGNPSSYFGNKWSFNYDTHYILDPSNNVLIIRPDGREDTYTRNTDNTFTAPPNVFDTLTDDGGDEYTLTLHGSRIKYHYNAAQNLAYIEDRWGNRLTSL